MFEEHHYTPSLFTLLGDGDVSWDKMVYYRRAGNPATIEPDRSPTWGEGRHQIIEIERLMEQMSVEIQEKLPGIYSKDLIEVLFKLPYTKRSQLELAGLGNLKQLVVI
jgi:hypothetical protein